jgi:ATP-dependent RNA helicase MSS116, mitochondrial
MNKPQTPKPKSAAAKTRPKSTRSSVAAKNTALPKQKTVASPAKKSVRKTASSPRKSFAKSRRQGFLSDVRFDSLGLSPPTVRALKEDFKYAVASEVQAKTIPIALQGKDVFGKAGTGGGKTLAFLIPTIEACAKSPASDASPASDKSDASGGSGAFTAVVLSPSRELAQQTHEEAERLCKFHRLKACLVIGGVSSSGQIKQLNQACDIVVATPGRLNDLLKSNELLRKKMAKVKVFVLDEADRLLDPGFIVAVNTIAALLPPPGAKQTLLFTATVGDSVRKVSEKLLKDATFVDVVRADDPPARIKQEFAIVPASEIGASVAHVLRGKLAERQDQKIIVFVPGVKVCKFVAHVMEKALNRKVWQIHSDMDQRKRTAVVSELTKAKNGVVFATDVIARGLDIDDITFVLQVGWVDPETYTHRSGRTARAGREGEALLLVSPQECLALKAILKTRHPKLPLLPAAPDSKITAGLQSAKAVPLAPTDDEELGSMAFKGMLGAYKSHMRDLGWKPPKLISFMKTLFKGYGMKKIPAVADKLLKKMNLTAEDFKTPAVAEPEEKCVT